MFSVELRSVVFDVTFAAIRRQTDANLTSSILNMF